MKNKTNLIRKFINSIYNLEEFPKYIRDGVGKAILYALLLSVFIGGIKGISGVINVRSLLDKAVNVISEDKNQFVIINDELNLAEQPIKIEEKGILFYADDNFKMSDVKQLRNMTVNEDINFLMMRDGLYIKKNVNYIDESVDDLELYYYDLDYNNISNADIVDIISSARSSIYAATIAFYMLREFLIYIVSAFVIALLTIIPSRLWGIKFRLSSLFSLALYAYTLPNILVLILSICIPGVVFDTAGMVGALVYTYLAIRSIKKAFIEKVV